MLRGEEYKKEFWLRWLGSDEVSRIDMIRTLLIRTLKHRETDLDTLAYLIKTYLEDLLEIACRSIKNNEIKKELIHE